MMLVLDLVLILTLCTICLTKDHCVKDQNGGGSCKDKKRKCKWGYEETCQESSWFQKPLCSDAPDYRNFKSMKEKVLQFWRDTDFGYVKHAKPSNYLCKPNKEGDSSLICNSQLTYCHAKNIYIDMRTNDLNFKKVFSASKRVGKLFGGHCTLQPSFLQDASVSRGALVSWAQQLDMFSSLPFLNIDSNHCDVVVEKPTFFMQLDAIGNMYHHFCDFFNLYLSKHVYGSFWKGVSIAIWQTYASRTLGPFADMWKLFSTTIPYALGSTFHGKRVCFKEGIFALLPRMSFGMYYSTPVIAGCSHSGLFKAFSKFVVTGLKIKQERRNRSMPIRVTLLTRNTEYRRILNQKELMEVMNGTAEVTVRAVAFESDLPFTRQLEISHNTDLFIGIHGAGLTHLLFLPHWGMVFELYNTDDIKCYFDLARLRGVSYLTWEKKDLLEAKTEKKHSQYNGNPKFENYVFNPNEFRRLFAKAVKTVKRNLASYFPK